MTFLLAVKTEIVPKGAKGFNKLKLMFVRHKKIMANSGKIVKTISTY